VRDSIIWDDCVIDGTVENCIVTHGQTVTGTHRGALLHGSP
jgi:ADP-glucose pyrophosphorylase